ncbi:MAG: glycoside hydrolase family 9 [Armatimonadetes bacterium]|nr:glycoside hydrolase family 9 [Armatimonadota bacterium]
MPACCYDVGMKTLTFVSAMAALAGAVSCAARPQVAYPDFAVRRMEGATRPGLPPVTSRIHVDQFGYKPTETKVAVISDPQRGYNAADDYTPGPELAPCRAKDRKVVFRGKPTAWNSGAVHDDSGDRGWWFDFTSVKAPGEYYVLDPATKLRSPVFRIAKDVYRDVLRAAVRTFYYQRLSLDLTKPYAEDPWILPAYMNEDRRARAVWAKDDASTERDLSGGWMDAGDTNKYPPFNGDALSSLLYAYTNNPSTFGDDYGIPESGNGLPDLLDEVKYQLDWLVKMQDADGGVFIKMGSLRNQSASKGRFYGPKDTGATITFAMNTAHAARVYGEFPAWRAFADGLKERAERAWRYYKSHPRTHNLDTGEISAGIANRSAEDQDRLEAIAGLHLFALTGKAEYQSAFRAKAATLQQIAWGFWSPYGAGMAEALTEYLRMPNADAATRDQVRSAITASIGHDRFDPPVERDLYRAWMNPEAYHWGSNTVRASFGFSALLVADHGAGQPADRARMRRRAHDMLHSFHGVNPLSVVYLTNMERLGAELSVKRIWHERFNYDTPFASNPPPGYVVGGPNQSFGGKNGQRKGDVEWIKSQPRAKAYADFNEPWPTNSWEITENAIYYQAAYIRLLSGVMKLD